MLSAFCLRIYVYGLWSMVYGNYYHISFFFLNGYDMIWHHLYSMIIDYYCIYVFICSFIHLLYLFYVLFCAVQNMFIALHCVYWY